MKKLIETITNVHQANIETFKKDLKKVKTSAELNHWQYINLLPRGKKIDSITHHKTLKESKEYFEARKQQKINKALAEDVKNIENIFSSPVLVSAKISVEWKKSRTWGMNPTAELWATFEGEDSKYFKYGPVTGCGYDKLSTAVAGCLNQIEGLLKIMYIKKNRRVNVSNREIFGYGSGSGILPHFEGGVGVECYNRIFESFGFTFEHIASGKTYDVFKIKSK